MFGVSIPAAPLHIAHRIVAAQGRLGVEPAVTSDLRSELQETHKRWVLWLEQRLGLSKSKISTSAGMSDTTLSRIFHEDYFSPLSQTSILKVRKRFNVPGPDEFETTGFGEAEQLRYDAKSEPELAAIIKAMQAGRNAVEPWRLRTRALELIGCMAGDVVMVDLNGTPAPGDAVCAQIYDWNGGSAETVFRVFEAPFLVAASLEASLRKPLLVDDTRVVIKGVVVGSFRPGRYGTPR